MILILGKNKLLGDGSITYKYEYKSTCLNSN